MKTTLDLSIPTIELTDALSFSHVYQPIYLLENHMIFGHESLIRGETFKSPQQLFIQAEKERRLFDLDMSSIVRAILAFNRMDPVNKVGSHITVNVFPSTILEPAFLLIIDNLISQINVSTNQIIFELNEAETVPNLSKLKDVVSLLRKLGFKIALDDLGKGQSSLRIALELEPDMVKLDQYFSIDLDHSLKKQRFLEWITSYFKECDTLVTLEGIETAGQLNIAKQIGVHFGQGYHLGRPQALNERSFLTWR